MLAPICQVPRLLRTLHLALFSQFQGSGCANMVGEFGDDPMPGAFSTLAPSKRQRMEVNSHYLLFCIFMCVMLFVLETIVLLRLEELSVPLSEAKWSHPPSFAAGVVHQAAPFGHIFGNDFHLCPWMSSIFQEAISE